MPAARPGRAPRRLALAASLVAVAGAAVPTVAQAATQYPVKLDGIGVSTQLGGGGSFGLYTFAVQKATDGAQPTAWVSPFTRATNDKVTEESNMQQLRRLFPEAAATRELLEGKK